MDPVRSPPLKVSEPFAAGTLYYVWYVVTASPTEPLLTVLGRIDHRLDRQRLERKGIHHPWPWGLWRTEVSGMKGRADQPRLIRILQPQILCVNVWSGRRFVAYALDSVEVYWVFMRVTVPLHVFWFDPSSGKRGGRFVHPITPTHPGARLVESKHSPSDLSFDNPPPASPLIPQRTS
jgi:hypothetical protein